MQLEIVNPGAKHIQDILGISCKRVSEIQKEFNILMDKSILEWKKAGKEDIPKEYSIEFVLQGLLSKLNSLEEVVVAMLYFETFVAEHERKFAFEAFKNFFNGL